MPSAPKLLDPTAIMRSLRPWHRLGRLGLALALCAFAHARAMLPLQTERTSRFDLEVTGTLVGAPDGARRYVRYADLCALPTTKLLLSDEFIQGRQEVTVVFLSDFWKAMPVPPDADCLLATCQDEYASVFRREFIAAYRPFFVLKINGAGPDQWSGHGPASDPGPYAITVSTPLVPAAGGFLSLEHKKPWGVVTVEFARYAEKFHDAYAGRWASLSTRAAAGRELWVNACASCHPGPGRTFSGTKSHQAFAILTAIARGDPALFRRYVRQPTSVSADAKMEEHGYFTDDQLQAIIAFITAEQR
jgi:cytochrome c2